MKLSLSGPASPRDMLAIYLEDHDAGACVGIALARRTLRNNDQWSASEALEQLVADLVEDRRTAQQLMPVLDTQPSSWKTISARAAERVGRFKLNGRLRGYSRLSQVWEFEALMDAVAAKRRMWQMVQDLPGLQDAAGVDAERMLARADDQLARLEPLWRSAAETAFAGVRVDGGYVTDEPVTDGDMTDQGQ